MDLRGWSHPAVGETTGGVPAVSEETSSAVVGGPSQTQVVQAPGEGDTRR